MFCPVFLSAQQSIIDQINKAGTFDNWCVRAVEESGIIGGKTKYLYEFYGSPEDTLTGNIALAKPSSYRWRTNNVLAKVSGVTKGSTSVFPEKRGDGYCARLEVHTESVKAMGININVVSPGTFFLGDMDEPISGTKDPCLKVLYGIPFEGRPTALVFDYKAEVGHQLMRKSKEIEGVDYPEISIILQKRWVDEEGTTHALRVGTAVMTITENVTDWVNGCRLKVKYGDISGDADFQECEALKTDPEYAYAVLNSKGKAVPVVEEGWASEDDEPNYLIVKFLGSNAEPYTGGVGNVLWIDNVKIEM